MHHDVHWNLNCEGNDFARQIIRITSCDAAEYDTGFEKCTYQFITTP